MNKLKAAYSLLQLMKHNTTDKAGLGSLPVALTLLPRPLLKGARTYLGAADFAGRGVDNLGAAGFVRRGVDSSGL